MYKLVNLAINDWYAFHGLDIPIHGSMALIGPPGSGKSAIQDALQCVQSGNNQLYMRLNSAAGGEHRSVASYCLGIVADPQLKTSGRESAETTIVMTFEDEETKAHVSVGVLMRMRQNQPSEETRRFVAQGYAFKMSDFVEFDEETGVEYVASHDSMISKLSKEAKDFKLYPTCERYVEAYLLAMQPISSPNPVRVMKAMRQAINLKAIEDKTDFGRKFIFPEVPIDIKVVSQRIQKWREMEAHVNTIEAELQRAQSVLTFYTSAHAYEVRFRANRWLSIESKRRIKAIKADEAQLAAESLGRREAELDNMIAQARASLDGIAKRVREKIQIKAMSGHAEKLDLLDANERTEKAQIGSLARDLRVSLDKLACIADFATEAMQPYVPARFRAMAVRAEELKSWSNEEAIRWSADLANFGNLVDEVLGMTGYEGGLQNQLQSLVAEIEGLRSGIDQLDRYIKDSEKGVRSLPADVTALQIELQRMGIATVCLANVVRVEEPEWQKAVELTLGLERFALIIVDPEQSMEAHRHLLKRRQDFANCRLALTDRGGRDRNWNPGSLMDSIATDDAHAQRYLAGRLGGIMKAETEADLKRLGRAIMRDGRSSSGMIGRVYNDRHFLTYFGERVSSDDLMRLRVEMEDRKKELTGKQAIANLLQHAVASVRALASLDRAEIVTQVSTLATKLDRLEVFKLERENLRSPELVKIDLEIKCLEDESSELDAKILKWGKEARGVVADKTRMEQDAQNLQKEARKHADDVASIEDEEISDPRVERMLDLVKITKERVENLPRLLQEEIQRFGGTEIEALAKVAEENEAKIKMGVEGGSKRKRPADAEGSYRDFVADYPARRLASIDEADSIDRLFWIHELREKIENHELREHRAKVQEANKRMEAALKDDLLIKLGDAISEGKQAVEILNRRLDTHYFVDDVRYAFRTKLLPEFQSLTSVIKSLQSAKATDRPGLSLDGAEQGEEFKEVLKTIESMIADENAAKKLGDYRNYFSFEVDFKTKDGRIVSSEGRLGAMSGGQQQAPFYVAIAAAFANVYYPNQRSETRGCAVAILDEAFAKLDGPNTSKLVEFFKASHIQLLMAAPEDKRASFLNCVDGVITITRTPGTSDVFVDVERIGPKAKAAMEASNPEWTHQDQAA